MRDRWMNAGIAAFAGVMLTGFPLMAEDWTAFGSTAGGTHATAEIMEGPVIPSWGPVSLGGGIFASPVVAEGRVFLATNNSKVHALWEADGTPAWSAPVTLAASVIATPAVYRNLLIVVARGGYAYGLNIEDGTQVWAQSLGGDVLGSPVLSGSSVCVSVAFPAYEVVGLDALTGTIQKHLPTSGLSYVSPAVNGDLLVTGANDGNLEAFDLPTETLSWNVQTAGSMTMSSPAFSGGSIFCVPGGTDRQIYKVGAASGSTDPSFPIAYDNPYGPSWTDVSTSSVATDGTRIYFVAGDADGLVLFCFDAADGTPLWTMPLGGGSGTLALPTPAVSNGLLVVGTQLDHSLFVLDPVTGDVLDFFATDGTQFASPVMANGRIYAATRTGSVFAFAAANAAPLPPAPVFPADGGTVTDTSTPRLQWIGPADDADAPDNISVVLRIDTDGEVLRDWAYEVILPGGTEDYTMPDPIAYGTPVTWRLRAKDSNGAWSAWSSPATFTMEPIPDPVSSFTVVHERDAAVDLAWAAPTGNPTLSAYRLSYGPLGGALSVVDYPASATSASVTGLTNGTTYEFNLAAVDAGGRVGNASQVTAVPQGAAITLNGNSYSTLDDALAAAVSGDVLYIGAGTLYVSATTSVPAGVSFIGSGVLATTITGPGSGQITGITTEATFNKANARKAAPTVIANLTLQGFAVGIDTGTADVTIRNVIVTECGVAIRTGDGTAGGVVSIESATLARNMSHGIEVRGGAIQVSNSIVGENGGYGIVVTAGSAMSDYNDYFHNTLGDYAGALPGVGEMSVPVTFEDDPFLREAAGSATIDAGNPDAAFADEPAPNGGRVNLGAYGNTVKAQVSSGGGAPPEEQVGGGDDQGGADGQGSGEDLSGVGGAAPVASSGTTTARQSHGGGGCFLGVAEGVPAGAGSAWLGLLLAAGALLFGRRR